MKSLFFALILALPCSLWGQDVVISSKVIDRKTHEPLSFASVWIRGEPLGTITNLQGEFDFHIPSEFVKDTLIVSMLGYGPYQNVVSVFINGRTPLIELEETAVVLSEVTVSDSLFSGDILKSALARIEKNYPTKPYLMDGFYRDTKKVGGTYISLLEAAIKIYDEDYSEPRNKSKLHERVALQQVRRSLGYSSRFTSYFDENNLLEQLLLNNNVRYRTFQDDKEFYSTLKRLKNSWYNGREVYVLVQQNGYFMKIYIDTETYGIIHLEYERPVVEKWGKRRGLVGKFVSLRKTIDFKEYAGKMYLNYMTVDSKINWYDGKTDELKFETELHQQLLINKVYPNTVQKIATNEKMKSYGLQFQDLDYNKEFWDKYNVIKITPLDKKIIDDLGTELPLEKQFQE